jgi:hypothetical protein
MQLSAEDGFLEGPRDQPLLLRAEDASLLVEACFNGKVRSVLLHALNMTPGFFDLSSGEAGAILQKLRQYRIRLAVVCVRSSVSFSTHFGAMAAEEARGKHFGIMESRDAAIEWLRQTG